MEFDWDEPKRLLVLRNRQINFRDVAEAAFHSGVNVLTVQSSYSHEQRFLSVVPFDGKLWSMIWTPRGAKARIITVRRASRAEQRKYRQLYVQGT
jgi:uncharacterized DUF497 family protein